MKKTALYLIEHEGATIIDEPPSQDTSGTVCVIEQIDHTDVYCIEPNDRFIGMEQYNQKKRVIWLKMDVEKIETLMLEPDKK